MPASPSGGGDRESLAEVDALEHPLAAHVAFGTSIAWVVVRMVTERLGLCAYLREPDMRRDGGAYPTGTRVVVDAAIAATRQARRLKPAIW
jgi:hypothetical protein